MSKKVQTKKIIGIILAIIVIPLSYLIPEAEALGRPGITTLAVMLGAMALWVTDAIPAAVTGFVALMEIVLLHIAPMNKVFTGFTFDTVFFTMAIFSLSVITTKSSFGIRLIGFALKWSKANSKRLVLAFMAVATLLSSIMSNMSVTAMFLGFCFTLFKQIGAKPGQSNLAKCLLIGLPMATMNGGMATPAGSSSNVLVMNLYEQLTGNSISFLQWIVAGIPMAIVLTPICWFILTRILPPEEISDADIQKLYNDLPKEPLNNYDKKTMVFLIGMPILWILGNWIPTLNVTLVAIMGMALMFLPGINLMSWDEFQKGIPWTPVLMMGAVLSLGGVLGQTGVMGFITDWFLNSSIMNLNVLLILAISTMFIYVTNALLPVGPALITMFYAPLAGICLGTGLSAAVPALILAFILSGGYLLPFNPNSLITYDGIHYSSWDVFKTGLAPSIILVVLCVAWTPVISGILGI